MDRIQVLVSAEEKEAFRELAEREGLSLSAWLRQAGLSGLAAAAGRRKIETVDDLRAFFAACDKVEAGVEPDWEDHLRVIESSVSGGAADS